MNESGALTMGVKHNSVLVLCHYSSTCVTLYRYSYFVASLTN